MVYARKALLTLIILTLALFIFACNDRTVQESPGAPAEPLIEDAVVDDTGVDMEIVVQAGKKDRLPGSLKWGSVVMHASGKDFYFEQSAGLTYIYEHYAFSDYDTSETTTVTTDVSVGEKASAQQTVETTAAPAQQTQAAPDPAPAASPPPPDPAPAPAPAPSGSGSTVISNQDGYSSTSIIISDGTTFTQHSTTTVGGGSSSSSSGTSSGGSGGSNNEKTDEWYDW